MSPFDPSRHLSRRTAAIEETAINRMAQKARDLRAKGHDIVSLTLGEPDFDTPLHIREAAVEAMNAGFTHYAPVAGFPELRAAIAEKLKTENGLDYAPTEVVLANGAKQAITNAAFSLLDEGDEAILLAPFWASYDAIVRMAGATPIVLHAGLEEDFKVSAARIAGALSERTKLIFLNTPCNPSGAVYTREELRAIAEVLEKHPRAFLLADEIYEYIAFDGEPFSFAALPGMKERTVTVNGFSKGFAMTGWRLGYAAAPPPVAAAMSKVQSTFTAGANAFVQRAAIAALAGGRKEVDAMREAYHRRRDLAVERLREMPGVRVHAPAGTFYIFPNVSELLGKAAGNHRIETVDQLCDWLVEEHHVATVPGTAFGDGDCIRLSIAASDADITKGLDRVGNAFCRLG